MGKVDAATDVRAQVAVMRRVNADALGTFHHFNRLHDASKRPVRALPAQSDFGQHLYIRSSAAIEDRQLQGVQFHKGVVDADAHQAREQVLGGGDQHALLHQTGGVADASDMPPASFNLEVVQVGSAEDDPRSEEHTSELQSPC